VVQIVRVQNLRLWTKVGPKACVHSTGHSQPQLQKRHFRVHLAFWETGGGEWATCQSWCCASVKYIIRRNEVVELAGTAHSRESFLFHGSNSGAPHLAFFRIMHAVFVVHGPAGSMLP